ncbi:hypothetical protein ACS5PU_17775 [Pedobacter sp. GSP4]|uniref:hypothetical protein n=1 Tax=Pedobacter sp. GSP4 TaxID=3453716 RepID=UPI003EEF5D83
MSGKKYMQKKINVLVDLPDLGIIDLPIVYTMRVDCDQPLVYVADCEILIKGNLPGWLFQTTFSIAYTQTTDANATLFSLCGNKEYTNRHYEMMLSIVSSYIQLKEDAVFLKQQLAAV